MTELVRLERPREGVALLTLTRPEKLNALSMALVADLQQAFEELQASDDVRAVVLTGQGRAFSAGADVDELKDLLGPTALDAVDGVMRYHALATQVWECTAPTLAALNGPAVGGGASLALLCDVRIFSEDAFMKVNQLERGIVPDMGATYLLPRVIGHGHAAARMLLAEAIHADDARQLGLAYDVVPSEDVVGRALEVADGLAARSAVATRLTAQAIRAGSDSTLSLALQREADAQAFCAQAPDFTKSLEEFLGRRREQR